MAGLLRGFFWWPTGALPSAWVSVKWHCVKPSGSILVIAVMSELGGQVRDRIRLKKSERGTLQRGWPWLQLGVFHCADSGPSRPGNFLVPEDCTPVGGPLGSTVGEAGVGQSKVTAVGTFILIESFSIVNLVWSFYTLGVIPCRISTTHGVPQYLVC